MAICRHRERDLQKSDSFRLRPWSEMYARTRRMHRNIEALLREASAPLGSAQTPYRITPRQSRLSVLVETGLSVLARTMSMASSWAARMDKWDCYSPLIQSQGPKGFLRERNGSFLRLPALRPTPVAIFNRST